MYHYEKSPIQIYSKISPPKIESFQLKTLIFFIFLLKTYIVGKNCLAEAVLKSLFVLRFYGPVNPMGSCRARSVYLTTRLLGRLSPLSG